MKLLVVDVGNTSTAVGIWQNGRVSRVAHLDGSFDEVAFSVSGLATSAGGLQAAAYASVVPRKDARFRTLFRRLGLRLVAVDSESFKVYQAVTGLKLDYPHPAEIGADRFADAAGAYERYGAPTLIMDFGTALTAAVITHDRIWRGGVIAPGFPLMRDYMFERTAKLPRMSLPSDDRKSSRAWQVPRIGRTTEEAMRFGALIGYRGMVREIVAELEKNFQEDFRLVATGGFAKWVLKDAGMNFSLDPDLTLYGVGLVCAKSL